MERGNKALLLVLLVTMVIAGGRMMFVGAGEDTSKREQIRSDLFANPETEDQSIAYPTRREIEESMTD